MSTSIQPTTTDLNATFTKPHDPVVDGTTTAAHAKTRIKEHPHHGQTREAFEKLEEDLKVTKDAAINEGEQDVEAAKTTYLGSLLQMADTGLSTAQSYITAGKEKLHRPQPDGHNAPTKEPSGITSTLTSTAAAALDAASRGLGAAQQTLHDRAGTSGHSTSVTLPSKPAGEHLADAQVAAQPHVDAIKAHTATGVDAVKGGAASASATAAPYVEKASDTAAPYVQKVQDTAAPVIQKAQDTAAPYVKSAFDAAEPYATKATEVAQPHVDAAAAKLNDIQLSDKSYAQQGNEALGDAAAKAQQAAEDARVKAAEAAQVAQVKAQQMVEAAQAKTAATTSTDVPAHDLPKHTEPTDAPTVL